MKENDTLNEENYILNEEEKKKARKNGFIILGKTGVGKTTLLNIIFDKEMGKIESSSESVSTRACAYYYRLKNNKYIALIDTPGLSDTKKLTNENIDNDHLNDIIKVISEENIQLKGILFLVNFQSERFDCDEQNTLLKYNLLFPVKKFWKNLIVVFTHYYPDPDGDDVEEMKSERDKSNGEIFTRLMEKVKNISNPIDYKQLKIKYINSHFPIKKADQKTKNMKVREELEEEFNKLIDSKPLFSQVEIMRITNYRIDDKEAGKQYLAEVQVIGYFDLNGNNIPINEEVKILSKREISENEVIPEQKIKVNIIDAKIQSDNSIDYNQTVEFPDIDEESIRSKYIKNYKKKRVK